MFARRQALFALSVTLLGAACTESTAPTGASATVVVPDTVMATRQTTTTAEFVVFDLPVSIHNTASVPLSFTICASTLEVQNAGVWTGAWAPYCLYSAASHEPIAPGETRVLLVAIAGTMGGNWTNATVSGTYRLTAALLPDGFSGTIPTIRSNTFTVLQGQ